MNRSNHAYALSSFARLMRSDVTRWLVVVVLAPMLAVGTFGGAEFLVHTHDDGTHFHPVGLLQGAELAAAVHADHHGQDRAVPPSDWADPCDEDECEDEPGEVPEGVIVSIDIHKQLPTRGTDLGKSLLPPVMFVIAVFVMPPSPDLDRHVGSPGGAASSGPLDLVSLSASDRLVRTSRALLI